MTEGWSKTSEGDARVLFEDAHAIVISKPEGLATIPERSREKPSLLAIAESMIGRRLFIVHRIDKEASGAVIFAKDPDSHRVLNDQFAKREISKTYLALVHGIIESGGIINRPIRAYGSGRMGVDDRKGKASTTRYEVSRRLGMCTLVNAFPDTGRRHQIRVHFYSVGHAIVGDRRYGHRETQMRFPRLMLHALSVSFRSPAGDCITVEAPVPVSFGETLDLVTRSGSRGNRLV
jgi:tRNA pseudouridine32 synthase/23S rRNA pseudouridine746 synthase